MTLPATIEFWCYMKDSVAPGQNTEVDGGGSDGDSNWS